MRTLRGVAHDEFIIAPGHTVDTYYAVGELEMKARCSCGWKGPAHEAQRHVFKTAVLHSPRGGRARGAQEGDVTLSIRVDTEAVQRAIRAVQELGEALSALQVTLEDAK